LGFRFQFHSRKTFPCFFLRLSDISPATPRAASDALCVVSLYATPNFTMIASSFLVAHAALAFTLPAATPFGYHAAAARSAVPVEMQAVAPAKSDEMATIPITRIPDEASFTSAIRKGAADDSSLCIIKYFAPWCRGCKGIKARFDRLAMEHPEHRFYDVCFPETKDMCQQHDIRQLPTIAVYSQGTRIFQECVTSKKWKMFEKNLDEFMREAKGEYVPRNTCDDNYWTCSGEDDDDVTNLDYGCFSGDGSQSAES
jgi:thiol-disulfide isomerase/thioredoxin